MKRTIQLLAAGAFCTFGLFIGVNAAQAATYTVQSGDTLSKLFPSTWQSVCSHYGIDCNLIYPGQVYSDDNLQDPPTAVAGVSTSQPAQVAPAPTRSVPTHLVVGKPYVWGAAGPNAFDCSGMTQFLASQMGFSIPRNSYGQMYAGRAISYGEMLPGDIIVMRGGGHVGTYLGNHQMIQALNPSQGILISSVSYGTAYNPVHSYRALGH